MKCINNLSNTVYYYRPQRSWGKVIFSQASMILFMGGLPQCMLGYHPPGPGRHPPGAEHTGRYGQRAGGMHPTGMQSCYFNVFKEISKHLPK